MPVTSHVSPLGVTVAEGDCAGIACVRMSLRDFGGRRRVGSHVEVRRGVVEER